MSKQDWNTLNPSSGKGDTTVNVGGSVHTGRLDRVSTPVFKPKDPALAEKVGNKTLPVTQKGKPEFVILNDVAVGKAGDNIIMSGRSNSSKLTFSLGEGDLYTPLFPYYIVSGVSMQNGNPITDDPGAVEEFEFTLKFTVHANATTNVLTRKINVVAAGGQTAAGTITQEAGDPFLGLESESVEIPADGTPVAVRVNSTIEWITE